MEEKEEVSRLNALSQDIASKQSEAMQRFSTMVQEFNELDRQVKDLLLTLMPEEQEPWMRKWI